jgi:hypothetical protein
MHDLIIYYHQLISFACKLKSEKVTITSLINREVIVISREHFIVILYEKFIRHMQAKAIAD